MVANSFDDDKTQSFVPLTGGTKVSHYEIVSKIGAGGMGEVYLAQDSQLDRKVALKFLPFHLSQNEASRARFTREAKAAAKLDHPNIVPVHEVGEFQGRPFFAMAHIEGKTLREVIKQGKLTVADAVDLTMQICEGLNEAHNAGVVHRDIKPANIIIDKNGKPRLLDFGLATVTGEEKLTKTGSTFGTAGYMSPEQVQGQTADHRSDLFSVGVVLYEMITSRTPFDAEHEAAIHYNIINESPEPMSRYKSGVSVELQVIIDRALDKNTGTRYQTATGILADLRRLKTDSGKPRTRRVGLWIASAAAVVSVSAYFLIERAPVEEQFGLTSKDKTGWQNSIAVLPLRDFSSNKDQEYFSDGMTDAIIGKLSGIKNLKVISMTSVMRYKNPDRDLKKIGHDLQVNTILEGSIQIEGNRLRVRAQLINVADDAHLWTQTYNRELESIFDIQDDISQALVDAMRIELLDEGTKAISRRYTKDVEAFNYYSRGRHLWNKRTEEDLLKAIEYFERAIELDSSYALAWAGLADGWAILPGYSDALNSETLPKAKRAVETALEIDHNLAEAHSSLGLILWNESDLQGAEREFQRSIDLNPGYHWAHFWYSKVLGRLGRFREQTEHENLAFQLNPMSIPLVSGRAARKKATFEIQEAEEMYQRLIEIEPNRWTSYVGYADLLAMTDRREEALKQCSLAVQINKQAYNNLAFIYDRVGDFEGALWAANKYIEFAPDNPNSYDTRGYIYRLYGQLDNAISSFEKALELDPDFASSIAKLGAIYVFRQEYEKAESLYQALASHPNKYTRAWGRSRLATVPAHQGKFKEAFRMLNELEGQAVSDSLSINSQLRGHFTKAIYYTNILHDVESALAEAEYIVDKLKKTEVNNGLMVDAGGVIAVCYAHMGDFETANRLMKEQGKALDNYEYFAASVYWISNGRLEGLKGNHDLASIYLERAARTLNGFVIWRYYAQSLLESGRPHEATEIYERLIDRYDSHRSSWAGHSVFFHYWLGKVYEETGRPADAIAQYETFLDIWKNADSGIPSIEDAKKRLAKLKS